MNEQETIADIIAKMHRFAEQHEYDHPDMNTNAQGIQDYADRLEAAWKREKSAIEADALAVGGMVEASRATAEKPSAVGDRAKMREALLRCDAITQLPEVRNEQSIKDMRNIIKRALAAPQRNCDRFATPEDARKEHRKICEEYGACNKACGYKSGHSGIYQCFEAWLFAPATEKEGENDGNK